MDNTPVTPVTHHTYLVKELQSDLRWTTQIQNTTNKAQKKLNMLKRNLKQACTTVKSQAYKTIVTPQLEYASAIWDPHTQKICRPTTSTKLCSKIGPSWLFTLHKRLFLTITTKLASSSAHQQTHTNTATPPPPQTITDWNSLPPSLCVTPTVYSFKEGLTPHFSPNL